MFVAFISIIGRPFRNLLRYLDWLTSLRFVALHKWLAKVYGFFFTILESFQLKIMRNAHGIFIAFNDHYIVSCYIKDAVESNLVNSFLSFLQSEPRLGQ